MLTSPVTKPFHEDGAANYKYRTLVNLYNRSIPPPSYCNFYNYSREIIPLQDFQSLKTLDISINGSMVRAEVIEQDGDEVIEEEGNAVAEDDGMQQSGDIVTELPSGNADHDAEGSSDDMHPESYIRKDMPVVNDIVTMATPVGRRQVFAEIIEEEIIEEIDETVVVSLLYSFYIAGIKSFYVQCSLTMKKLLFIPLICFETWHKGVWDAIHYVIEVYEHL